jgi:quinol monooxygenase YgiN
MAQISMFARLQAQPGRRDELLVVLKGLADAAVDEPGTLQYVFATPDDDPDTVLAFELYADEDAFQAHSSSPAMIEVIGRIGDLVAGIPELIRCTPVMGKGI